MHKVIRALNDISLERGRRNEERFFEAMNDPLAKDLPPWILRARRPTSTQDKFEGIDAIIETSDVGKLFVQIKSSMTGANNFKNGRHFKRNSSIVVVVIRDDDTPKTIRAQARKLLSELRFNFQNFQYHTCHKQGS